jgi:hypothetical protein
MGENIGLFPAFHKIKLFVEQMVLTIQETLLPKPVTFW